MKKLSELLKEKQTVAKAEIINVIKKALPQDGSEMTFELDEWRLSIGYSTDCECFDDLNFLYVANKSVLASFWQEPENETELEYFHESSLISVVDYLERHGFISQTEAEKVPHEDEQPNMMGMMKATKQTKVRDWYIETYPHDELARGISESITFEDVFNTLDRRKNVYILFGVTDSVIRESIFSELATIMEVDYDYIYDQWLLCDE